MYTMHQLQQFISFIRSNVDYLPARIISATVLGILFAGVGWLVPRVYYESFDNIEYLEVRQPILVVEPVLKPCQEVPVIVNRRSSIDTVAELNVEVLNSEGLQQSYQIYDGEIVFEDTGGEYVPLKVEEWELPCHISEGRWLLQGVIKYNIRGVEKNYRFISSLFTIENPKEATDSADLE